MGGAPAVLVSSTIARVRQRGMTLGEPRPRGGDDCAREPRRARSAAVVLGNLHDVDFVGYNARKTTWDDPRLPSMVDAGAPQYRQDYRRKIVYFRASRKCRRSPDRRRQVRHAGAVGRSSRTVGQFRDHAVPAGGPPQAAYGQVRG